MLRASALEARGLGVWTFLELVGVGDPCLSLQVVASAIRPTCGSWVSWKQGSASKV